MSRHRIAPLLCLLLISTAHAQSAPTQQQRFVPDFMSAWNGLSGRADALAAARNGAPDATQCKHYQGLARKDGPDGTPYLILTQSGTVPGPCLGDPEPGVLHIVKMESRGKHGERMTTNILPYEGGLLARPHLATDKEVVWRYFNGNNGWPAYRHTGGMQLVGDVLVIGAEDPFGPDTYPATFLFIDVHDPEAPVYLGRFNPPDISGGYGADPVAITQVSGGRYLLASAGGDGNEQLRFFRSQPNTDGGTTDLKTWPVEWDEVGRYSTAQIEACMGGSGWPTADLVQGGQHQMLNFVREGDLNGALYLIGGRRDGTIVNDFVDEYLELYGVNVNPDGTMPATCPLTKLDRKLMSTGAWGVNFYSGSFSAGSGTYISPSGELIVYKTAHDSSPAIAFGEYRIHSLVRPDSPTLRPTASINGTFTVPEGSSVSLTGQGAPAITKAFVQLFQNTGAGVSIDQLGVMVEYDQRFEADWANLDQVILGSDSQANPYSMAERTSAIRWFAPPGCTIGLNDYPLRSSQWPGDSTVVARGSGVFQQTNNLAVLPVYAPADEFWPVTPVPSGITATNVSLNDDIEGVTFFHDVLFGDVHARSHTCDTYYNAPITLSWDLDGNGSFESTGSPLTFSAALLDGPSTPTVRARAQHSTDTSPTGSGDPIAVSVTVTNVAPQLGTSSVTDTLGRSLAGGANMAIIGLPVRLAVDFTDPGRADTQSAAVTWGDGASNTTFNTFTQATGGVTGTLRHQHVFSSPGSRTITATITDDDNGASPVSWNIVVLSLEGAIQGAAAELTNRIAQATNPNVAAALRSARDELIGNHEGRPTNGAIDALSVNDPAAAITKLHAAVEDLLLAQSLGAGDLRPMIELLGMVGEGIATAAFERAKAAVPNPKPAQVKTLTAIADFIVLGHQKLSALQYLAAFDNFRQAAVKAAGLK